MFQCFGFQFLRIFVSKLIFAKRTHSRIKLNQASSDLVKPSQTKSNQFFINGHVGLCQNDANCCFLNCGFSVSVFKNVSGQLSVVS